VGFLRSETVPGGIAKRVNVLFCVEIDDEMKGSVSVRMGIPTNKRSVPGQIGGSRVVLMFAVFALTFVHPACAQPSDVNFSHLQHLTETVSLNGGNVNIVHVYANYPDYRWLEAADAGTEGVACIDDAARAAVLYLRHYELSHDNESLLRARALLAFVLKMQSDDGEFYNFIYQNHSINTTGRTSLKSFGWVPCFQEHRCAVCRTTQTRAGPFASPGQ
jgi:hypothetical protein